MKKILSMKKGGVGLLLASLTHFLSCNEASGTADRTQIQETLKTNSITIKQEKKLILFFGNNATAKYGLKPQQTFPELIQQRIDSMEMPVELLNAGLVEGTSTEARNRINWMLNEDIDIFVMEVGINDKRAGIPLEQTQENIQAIIDTVQSRNPDTTILLAGVENLPSNTYSVDQGMLNLYSGLVKDNEVSLIPCVLELENESPMRNKENNLYATEEGQQVVAHDVWQVLRPLLIHNNSVSENH